MQNIGAGFSTSRPEEANTINAIAGLSHVLYESKNYAFAVIPTKVYDLQTMSLVEAYIWSNDLWVQLFTGDRTTLLGNFPGISKWRAAVVAANGVIYCVPSSATRILKINPYTDETTLFGNFSGSDKWYGQVMGG